MYARDIKPGDQVHTVFKTTGKERHQSRAGKVFLSFTLFDRTGALDGRVFEQVEAAEKAFVNDDYLLVKGKVITFHGKPQLVVDRLERLDPEPIDAKEFGSPPAPSEAAPSKATEKADKSEGGKQAHKHLRAKLMQLLDDPEVVAGIAAVLRHVEQWGKGTGGGGRADESRRQRGPKPAIEHRPKPERSSDSDSPKPESSKPEAKRDPSLPKELAFKPFSALAGAGDESKQS